MQSVQNELAVLIVEDSESDAALVEYELKAKGYTVRSRRVETARELREALQSDWDVIISDFRLPQFNAITALDALRESGKDIPFILVSQAIGEGVAVELMRAGAADYVMKSSLKRLGPAVEREVREAKVRAAARVANDALVASERRLAAAQEVARIGNWETDLVTLKVIWSNETYRIFELDPEKFSPTHKSFLSFVHSDDKAQVDTAFRASMRLAEEQRLQHRIITPQGHTKFVEERWRVERNASGEPIKAFGTCQDITDRKKLEKKLSEREEFLASVIASQINGIIAVTPDGGITIANESAAQILELKRDEVTGRYYQNSDHWKQIDQDFKPIPAEQLPLSIALREGRGVSGFEHGIVLPDGRTKWLSVSCSPIRDSEGTIRGAVASFLEITEVYLQRERNLQQLHRLRLQDQAINSSNSGVIISDMRLPDMPVTFVNRAFTEITGYSAEEVLGKNCRFLHGDDLDQPDLERLRATLRNREAGEFVLRNYRKDGAMFRSKLSLAPVKTEAAEVTHYVAIQTDVTQQYEASRELELARDRMQLALNGAALGMIDVNLSTNENYLNSRFAEIIGYERKELSDLLRNPLDFVHPDDAELTRKAFADHYAGLTEAVECEHRIRHKNGAWVWVLSRGKTVERDATGRALRYTGTILDITERKKNEAAILELSQRLIDISESERAEISSELHDVLGQSLVLMKLNLQKFLGDRGIRTPENEKLLLEPVAETLKKAREISRRLTPSHMKKVGLALALEDMLHSAGEMAGVKITADLDALEGFFPQNWNIGCYRIVQEAVTNALKHSGAGKIEVRTRRVDNNLQLTISDNGAGFTAESDTEGIGLALMRERVRGLRGHLFFDSSAGGLTVSVLIPQQPETAGP